MLYKYLDRAFCILSTQLDVHSYKAVQQVVALIVIQINNMALKIIKTVTDASVYVRVINKYTCQGNDA